jgi:uncharacterized YigZ family protein
MNKERYGVPAQQSRAEIEVLNSRFIATIAPAFSVDEAREFIASIKSEFKDASHNVAAYVIGHGSSVTTHCHDDGEPSGTAGRPALAVLSGSGLGDVAVVVTRYFGGIKLGTGGLVRAYGNAVRAVLEVVPRAEKAPLHTIMLAIPYPDFERVRLLVEAHKGAIINETFGVDVTLTARFGINQFLGFETAIQELSRGAWGAEIIETEDAIVPTGSFGGNAG